MKNEPTRTNPALVAVEAAGGRKALSEKLRCSRQAVDKWVNQGQIPIKRVPQVSKITGIPKGVLSPAFR